MKRLFAVAFFAICLAVSGKSPHPNIVFLLADDLGYGDLGCYGAPDIKTPNLDRLAKQGIRFTDFYANGCVCTPTRCALMTGRYQQHIGGLETAIPPGAKDLGLPRKEKTLADMLRSAGYATAMSGKWHLGYKRATMPNAHGFDHFFGLVSGNHDYFTHRENNGEPDLYLDGKPAKMDGYSTDLITDHALKFLDQIRSKPFFLYVAFNAPHFPAQGPDDRDVHPTPRTWNSGNRATYVKMVEAMDAGIGKVLDALDRYGLRTNTLVVFQSDNGGATLSRNAPLNKGKASLWEGGIRVPCIARFPGKIDAGLETHQVAITMDWTMTIAKLAGAKTPYKRPFEGMDLMPYMQFVPDEREQTYQYLRRGPRTLFWRNVNFSFQKLFRAARDGDWKYIENYKTHDVFLYDLAVDIGETNNLADKNPKIVAKLKAKLDNWERAVDPPFYSAEPPVKPK